MKAPVTVIPRVAKRIALYPKAEPIHLLIAEAVRDACLKYTSMNHLSDVEHMDLNAIVVATLMKRK